MLDEAARVNENGGPYAGLDRFEARKKLWEDMRQAGLVIKEEPYTLNVPRSQRGGEIVEPMISTQWFVRIQPLAEAALAGGARWAHPHRARALHQGLLQLAGEHPGLVHLPPALVGSPHPGLVLRRLRRDDRHPPGSHRTARTAAAPTSSRTRMCWTPGSPPACGPSPRWAGPTRPPTYKYFYPTSIMETGYDILFFWVARMIMAGLEFTGQVPFHTVYLHGLIRDEHGRKMSKSYGNVIDPLVVMDELGTDALRFTLLVGSTPGNDMNLSVKKVEANRNFANKIWNAGRFVISAIGSVDAGRPPADDRRQRALDPGRFVDLGAPASAGARCGAPVPDLPVRRGRAADL